MAWGRIATIETVIVVVMGALCNNNNSNDLMKYCRHDHGHSNDHSHGHGHSNSHTTTNHYYAWLLLLWSPLFLSQMLVLLLVGVCNILTECQFPDLVFAGVQARNQKIQNIGDLEIMEARHRGIKKLKYQDVRLLITTTNYYNVWYHQCCPHLHSSSGRCLPGAPRLRD